ncbi:hypothetical protein CARUB_v10024618mg [Capsella rubella]|uniref:Uncharacterized protein n=1 Tax=Capsella rubella TaxID=81985 RepID=R0FZ86_9BRAS|nr:hypothetical protein CARUB_v10024618mg [Capsella rubella]
MGITKSSITVFLVIVLTISFSYYSVTALSETIPGAEFLYKCGGRLDNRACFHDCSRKGYKHGFCLGVPSTCVCFRR